MARDSEQETRRTAHTIRTGLAKLDLIAADVAFWNEGQGPAVPDEIRGRPQAVQVSWRANATMTASQRTRDAINALESKDRWTQADYARIGVLRAALRNAA